MKKSVFVLFTFLLLFSSVSAQTNEGNITVPKINPNDPTPRLDEKLDEEISIPQGFKTLARVGLGISPDENIRISNLITIIALWIVIFIVVLTGAKAAPFLGPTTSYVASICFMLLISSTKSLKYAADQWLFNENFFIFLDNWSFGNLIIKFAILLIGIVLGLWLIKRTKKDEQKEKEEIAIEKIKIWAKRSLKNQ